MDPEVFFDNLTACCFTLNFFGLFGGLPFYALIIMAVYVSY